MKGGDIVVEGAVGYLTGFMAHTGRIIVLGEAGDACGDSLWGGEVWVGGAIKSLGVDSKVIEPEPEEVEAVAKTFFGSGITGTFEWKKIVSAEKLWHFESRDASAWLMI